MSAPSWAGWTRQGLANVLSTTTFAAGGVSQLGNGRQIRDMQERIRYRLQEDEARRFLLQRSLHCREILHIHEAGG